MAAFHPKTTRYLEEKNPIKGTSDVKFQDEGHLYWAYSNYYNQMISNDDGCGALPLISATTVLNNYFHFDRNYLALKIWNDPLKRHAMEYDVTDKYYGCKSIDDVLYIFGDGARQGTEMHGYYEDMANLLEYDKDHPPEEGTKLLQHLYIAEKLEGYYEKAYFYEFVKKFKLDNPASGIRFHRTELLMWNDVLHITGTADGLLYDENDDSYIIVDWKRIKGGVKCDPKNPKKPLHELSASGRGMGLEIFEKMYNNTMNKYGCQLTIYKKLFEYMTGKRVSGLYIVAIDSNLIGKTTDRYGRPISALKIHEVPLTKYDEAIRQAFEERAREILGKCENTLNDDHMDKLIEIIDEGDRIREERILQMEQEQQSDDEEVTQSPKKKQKK